MSGMPGIHQTSTSPTRRQAFALSALRIHVRSRRGHNDYRNANGSGRVLTTDAPLSETKTKCDIGGYTAFEFRHRTSRRLDGRSDPAASRFSA